MQNFEFLSPTRIIFGKGVERNTSDFEASKVKQGKLR